jgi:hypothetical protein
MVALINYDGMGSTLGTLEWTGTGDDKWFSFLAQTQQSLGMDLTGNAGPSGTDATNFSSLEVPSIQIGQAGSIGQNHTPADNLLATSPIGMEDGLAFAGAVAHRLAFDAALIFPHKFPDTLLKQVRDYAARWGWGVRPEGNLPPRAPQ